MDFWKNIREIAEGKSIASTYFLLLCMVVWPTAFFTDWIWLDSIAWGLLQILGVFIFWTGYVTLQTALKSKKWPKVDGVLEKAFVHSVRRNNANHYAPKVVYLYEVEGDVFRGETYDFSASTGGKVSAEKQLARATEQDPLQVHYDPIHPSESVLFPGPRLVHYLRLLLGPAMFVVSLLSQLEVIVWR